MVSPLHRHLNVVVCADVDDAIARGYDWLNAKPAVKPIKVNEVVVVRNGTQAGKPTVDFLLEDDTGQRFVFLVTGALLKSIPC